MAAAIGVLLMAGLLSRPAASVETASEEASTTFTPVADAHVRSDTPNTNYGSSIALRVGGAPTSHGYLRFDLTGSGPVSDATLKLYASSSAPTGGLAVHSVSDNRWSERTITYSNAPSRGPVVAGSENFRGGRWVEIDVTSQVKGDGPVTLALSSASSSSRQLASRESSTPPQLEVELRAPPSSPSPPPNPPPPPPSPPPPSPPPPSPSPGGGGGLQPHLPVRAVFYYPWFPEAWSQKGIFPYTRFNPSLGFYRSNDPAVIQKDIRALEYGKIEAGISSWWGPGTKEDARFPLLLKGTDDLNSLVRWAPYYEAEGYGNPTPTKIASDLAYIKSRYASDPAYLRVDGKPVIFVYGTSEACSMADRWKQANANQGFYVVLKVFSGYRSCPSQPNSWHQYAPARATDRHAGHSYSISPGFNKADEAAPRLGRDLNRWRQNIRDMVASSDPWQLITTFNEWGEGTSVQSATQWASISGYGLYLDALHNDGNPVPPPPSPPPPSPPPPPPPPPPSPPPPSPPPPSPPPPPGSNPVIAAAGDIACDPTSGGFNGGAGTAGACHMRATSNLLTSAGLAAVLPLGDLQYENGALTKFQLSYAPSWGRLRDISYPAPGNHEYGTGGASGYFDYFNGLGSARGRAGDRGKGYYSYDIGSWHLVALNSNCGEVGGCGAGSPQESWLRSDLAAHPNACTLAYWHHPRFSSGTTHGNDSEVGPLWTALYNANADLVLSGHEHNYERFSPQDPAGAANPARGIREFVVGTGGKNHYGFGAPKPNSEARSADTYGVLKLTLRPTAYDWNFQPDSPGGFSDSGSGSCH